MIKGEDGAWYIVSKKEAVDAVKAGFEGLRKEHGGRAIMGLISGGCSNEELGVFKELMTKEWAAGYVDTLDGRHYRTIFAALNGNKPAFKEARWADITTADLLLQIGADPEKTHPVVGALIRRAILENASKVLIVGDENRLGDWADGHVQASPAELASLLQAFSRESGLKVEGKAGKGRLFEGLSDMVGLFKKAKNPVIVIGDGLTGGDPAGLKLALELARSKGVQKNGHDRLIVLKPAGNSSGAWKMGVAADSEAKVGDIHGALICLNGVASLDRDLMNKLEGPGFIAVVATHYPEALAGRANVLLPKATWLEADGTYARADGSESLFKSKILKPPPGVEAGEKILAALSGRAG